MYCMLFLCTKDDDDDDDILRDSCLRFYLYLHYNCLCFANFLINICYINVLLCCVVLKDDNRTVSYKIKNVNIMKYHNVNHVMPHHVYAHGKTT